MVLYLLFVRRKSVLGLTASENFCQLPAVGFSDSDFTTKAGIEIVDLFFGKVLAGELLSQLARDWAVTVFAKG